MREYTIALPSAVDRDVFVADQVARCFADADLRRFRDVVFLDCAAYPLAPSAAAALQEGLRMHETGQQMAFRRSFVTCCRQQGCTDFVRNVVETGKALLRRAARRHNVPEAGQMAFLRKFAFFLCSGEREPQLDFMSPADQIPRSELTGHRELVQVLLEYLPDDDGLLRARESSDELRAFITECEMELRIRQQRAASPAGAAEFSAPAAPRASRRML